MGAALRRGGWRMMGGVLLVLVLGGCTRESEPVAESKPAVAPAAAPPVVDRLVAVNPTPAFRNLGKRAEAKL